MRRSLSFLPLLFSLSLYAQSPYLVKDINTTLSNQVESSTPQLFTAHGNRTYFVAETRAAGREVWSTDGTTAGTSILTDIIPGKPGAETTWLRSAGGSIFFNARDVDHGVELWTTDGTAAGTRMLLDISPGPNSASPSALVAIGDRWLFSADDGTHGRELWITDGTAGGTRMLKEIAAGSASANVRSFTRMGNAMYFLASGGLWRTDGTETGTVLVRQMGARNLTAAGSKLFLEGYTVDTSWELWVSDGTDAGTVMLPEIQPGRLPGFPDQYSAQPPTPFGERVLFLADDGVHGRELWISDGTAAGTFILVERAPGPPSRWIGAFLRASAYDGRAYFSDWDQEHGLELWVTDGTKAGTNIFADLEPGQSGSFAVPLSVMGGKLLFTASSKLFVTDGTLQGTRFLRTPAGEPVRYFSSGSVTGDEFHFAGSTPLAGVEPWVTDGTDAGTRMIANIEQDGAPSSTPRFLTATNDLLFFHAIEGVRSPQTNVAEWSLWRTDGTTAGTGKLRESGQHPAELTGVGPYVFFLDERDRRTRMMSDGTIDGTEAATDFLRRFGDRALEELYPFGDTLFAAVGDSFSTTLWKTTAAPRSPAVPLGGTRPSRPTEVAGRFLYYAESPTGHHDRGLWITDGTPEGTRAVVPDLGRTGAVSEIVSAQGAGFFLKAERESPTHLWKTDGTFDGTVAIRELPDVSTRVEIESTGQRIFFLTGTALWTSDGTAAGTIELAKTRSLTIGLYDDFMKVAGDRVVFVQRGTDSSTSELWTSDGTVDGTKMLMQVPSRSVTSIDGIAYFTGADDLHGREIWTTDGTAAGTRLFLDLNPGPASSDPLEFAKVRDTLYFTAYTDSSGSELWALPLTETRLSAADTRANESASPVRFTLTRAGEAAGTVSVAYNTSDGTARAGQDYESTSGTVTFAPGETKKTIDVRILADTSVEDHETFFLTLTTADAARILTPRIAGVIDDDDHWTELGVQVRFGGESQLNETVIVSNHGPRAAIDVPVTVTTMPAASQDCWTCRVTQIPAGGHAEVYVPSAWGGSQAYRSAIVAGNASEQNARNNAVSWTITDFRDLAMNAAFLTPGATATVTAEIIPQLPYPNPISGDSSIVSISSEATTVDGTAQFTVTAHRPGTTYLTVGGNRRNLNVTVVPEGATPRWPNGLTVFADYSARLIGEPVTLTITSEARAPLTGATATGLLTVTANGREIARRTIVDNARFEIPIYLTTLGPAPYTIAYAGDANFLPQTIERSVYMRKGSATMTGRLEREGSTEGTYRLIARLSGAPGAPPAGSVQVSRDGILQGTFALVPSSDDTSVAEAVLTGLTGSDVSVQVSYGGNDLYAASSTEIRFHAPRRRSVRP